jgi:hypothetical protein
MRTTATSVIGALVCATVGVLGGCSAVLGIESDRHVTTTNDQTNPITDGDAGADSAPHVTSGPWGCLEDGPRVLDPNVNVDLTVLVSDPLKPFASARSIDGGSDLTLVTFTPIPGVAVTGCGIMDPNCLHPLAGPGSTNDGGAVHFSVPQDFLGFYRLEHEGILPSYYYPGQFLTGTTVMTQNATLLSAAGAAAITSFIPAPVSFDPNGTVGHAFLSVYDCDDHHAAGITMTYNNFGTQTIPFYMKGGIPDTDAKQTDELGTGGVLNVPVGQFTMFATMAEPPHTAIGSVSVIIRPGALAFAILRVRSR